MRQRDHRLDKRPSTLVIGQIANERSIGPVPTIAVAPIGHTATLLTVVSMAALGVDIRTVANAGGRVTLAVVMSLLCLGGISLMLICMLKLS
ncbi:hypothetical protein [Sphingomonas sp. T9W2]|uniref:hypothetical protein n=1 Tax=Sphingomonas sp. T9W2 TaxID=3143183 RepID=UPI0031F4CE28